MKDQDIVAPRYADPGRKERVESFGCRSAIAWHEHTQKHNLRFDTLADDTASTRESCCKPDVMTNGRATELMMTDWGDYSFPFKFMNVPKHKLEYGDEYPDGKFVLMNEHETYAVSVPMTEEVDAWAYYADNYGKPMPHARFDIAKCHKFKLGKVDKRRN